MRHKLSTAILLFSLASAVQAQTTAFTYQGRLEIGGAPYTGNAEFEPTLWTAVAAGAQVAANAAPQVVVGVTNGLFVLPLDFGAAFPGADRWLQLNVRTNIGAFTTLAPRQRISPTPYALTAGNVSGVIANASLPASPTFSGTVGATTFAGSGASLTSLNASQLASGSVPAAALGNAWKIGGNAGTTPGTHFLGTTDNQALELHVSNQRAVRIEPRVNGPNLIGGHPINVVSNGVDGATIGGGGDPSAPQRIGGSFATITGGRGNTATGYGSTAIGYGTTSSGFGSVSMGLTTRATGDQATAMGWSSLASGNTATAMGSSEAAGAYSLAAVTGKALADYSIALGSGARAAHEASFVWADHAYTGDFSSTTNYQFRIRATGGMEVVGGTNTTEVFKFSGVRQGDFFSPLALGENKNTSGNSAPALRLVNHGGNSINGVLSVSTLGIGNLATFGNSSTFVSTLTTNGTWSALAFNPTSDRAAKENFTAVDPRDVLDKVAALPLARWNYKAAPGLDHIGPVAQDFHAAFGLNGTDDKHIATVDADGVALAAIQGLNAKVEVRSEWAEVRSRRLEEKLEQKETEIAELKQRLERLEQLLARQLD